MPTIQIWLRNNDRIKKYIDENRPSDMSESEYAHHLIELGIQNEQGGLVAKDMDFVVKTLKQMVKNNKSF